MWANYVRCVDHDGILMWDKYVKCIDSSSCVCHTLYFQLS